MAISRTSGKKTPSLDAVYELAKKDLVAWRDSLRHMYNVSIGLYDKNKTVLFKGPKPCHGILACHSAAVFWSEFVHPRVDINEQNLRMYFDWLTKESPWARLKVPGLIPDKEDPDFCFTYGWIYEPYKYPIPANLLHNFLMATRVPQQHSLSYRVWSLLVSKGFDPTLSFAASAFLSNVRGDLYHILRFDQGEYPLFSYCATKDYINNFLQAKLVEKNLHPPYYPAYSRPPINHLWGDGDKCCRFFLEWEKAVDKFRNPDLIAKDTNFIYIGQSSSVNRIIAPFDADGVCEAVEVFEHMLKE